MLLRHSPDQHSDELVQFAFKLLSTQKIKKTNRHNENILTA